MLPALYAAGRVDPASLVHGQPLTITVRPDGWTAELRVRGYVAGGALALAGGAVTINLAGTDALGNPYTRVAVGGMPLRQPAPNGTLREENNANRVAIITLALDQCVFGSETITSATIAAGTLTNSGAGGDGATSLPRTITGRACVNNSQWEPPKPGGRWISIPFQRVTTSTFSVEMVAAHRHAQQGRTVRAVKFDLLDSANTLRDSVTVTAMTRSVELPNLPAVPCYRATLSLAGIPDGTPCRVRATIYPWLGEAWVSDVDGEAWPSPNAGNLPFVADVGGTWGNLFAAVSTAGTDASGAVALTEASARATPFRTFNAALSAIRSYNNANRGRNNVDGAEIVIETGSYIGLFNFTNVSAFGSTTADAARAWCTFRPASGVTGIVLDGSTLQKSPPSLTRVVGGGITIQRSGTVGSNNASLFVGPDTATTGTPTHAVVLDGVGLSGTDLAAHTTPVVMGIGFAWFRNLTWTGANAAITNFSVQRQMNVQVAGCNLTNCGRVHAYFVVGSRFDGTLLFDPTSQPGAARITSRWVGWWAVEAYRQTEACYHLSNAHNSGGFAVLCLLERSGTDQAQPLMSQSADSNIVPVPEAINLCNTVIGSRTNQLYQDTGTALILKNGVNIGCVHQNRNNKSDYFPPASAARIGNWRFRFGGDCHSNRTLEGSANGTGFGPDSWLGERAEANSLYNIGRTGIFVADASANGTTLGNGDYRPAPGGPLVNVIPAALRPLPFDLRGVTFAGECGAYAAEAGA